DNRDRLTIPGNLIRIQNREFCDARTGRPVDRKRPGDFHLQGVPVCDDLVHTGRALGSGGIDLLDLAPRDGAEGESRMGKPFDRILGRKVRCSGDLRAAIESVNRLSHVTMLLAEFIAIAYVPSDTHCLPPSPASSDRTRFIVLLASSTLNAFPFRGVAAASSAAAALAKASCVAEAPRRSCSAAEARQGLCATPPSARRTSRITPSSILSAAATETRAKA